ncbi:SUF system NifU family Fe-S cluster assembly protein [Candidatus Gottesmanbacteria bacterium RIFCSPHIGHO2_01_FULL_46_14]|uniref:SUF system NifU family Fe-S cluster assembly protein n=3 Tax=Microgenomates group TaxID=1794810 RepID=A0A1F5ZPW6_9BACT|nr:MAG: SUF system FeS assembly protein, NifU family [Candidatus Curtissbacteria bacterium GW2011_GWA1_41_11]OGG14451.1 MAG: SUF system NifU family Fe-S cluster assembly protein [Candidatus Gottesmanbacteria bacterium RIFCSPHIGHO2_01_FULL_46_14]OGG28532.1 MAG: SUF system NifU family Fe-S cluster assembly protein [Candidatus Gottesmanbacteria bacterium RIFCSPLOWO2_01_FULL_46_21]
MDIYRENILDHYKHPRNFGHLEKPDVVMEEGNVTCGDKIIMEINVKNNKIENVAFNGEGCAISQASASMLTEMVKGMNINKIMKLSVIDITTILGTSLTPSRIKCATLPLEVLQKAGIKYIK